MLMPNLTFHSAVRHAGLQSYWDDNFHIIHVVYFSACEFLVKCLWQC